ncbi:hypothetical protein KCP71_09995 [Salmonella enterica subsp. enterica]|nr:hypothetical protein KCP71_09995 [Salmonella enterica subsp. enterica]
MPGTVDVRGFWANCPRCLFAGSAANVWAMAVMLALASAGTDTRGRRWYVGRWRCWRCRRWLGRGE